MKNDVYVVHKSLWNGLFGEFEMNVITMEDVCFCSYGLEALVIMLLNVRY